MQIKQDLRRQLKQQRAAIQDRVAKENAILQALRDLQAFRDAKHILCYVSCGSEISTLDFISKTLKDKAVSVPLCGDVKGDMTFYDIQSLQDLTAGHFGILEPDALVCEKTTDFSNALAVVPALCYDLSGCRLGYGGGYYDRFLSEFDGVTVGLCFEEMLCDALLCEAHDQSVDIVITEKRLILCKNGGSNGTY